MIFEEDRIWPFEVPPPEVRSDLEQMEVDFLQTAHLEGFVAYRFGVSNHAAKAGEAREGFIIVRGRRRWEVRLHEGDTRTACWFTYDFEDAARAVLDWLRGGPATVPEITTVALRPG